MTGERRIALVAFGDPHLLPPTMNAARTLAARGWQVDVLGIRWRARPQPNDPQPASIRVRLHGEVGEGADYYVKYLRFVAFCALAARRRRYHWIYAYDLLAAPIGRMMSRLAGARWVYHSHDLYKLDEMSRSQRLLRCKPRELAAVRHADLVVFPQIDRARIFAKEAQLAELPRIVYNCPPRDWLDGASDLEPRIAAFARRWPRLVIYQGGLSSDRGTAALLDSMAHWPADAGLVLVGDLGTREVAALRRRGDLLGLGERVLWRGPVPYHALPSITRAGSLGVFLTPPRPRSNINLELMAGASNKVFEYLACGLPVLVPDTPGFADLIEKPGHGQVCRDYRPPALGAQIARLLEDTPEVRAMRTRNVEAFRTLYHYEHQLAPVVAELERAQ